MSTFFNPVWQVEMKFTTANNKTDTALSHRTMNHQEIDTASVQIITN